MEYEIDFERGVMEIFSIHITAILCFRVLNVYDIDFDVEQAKILAPLIEREHILNYFERNGFTVKQCIGMWYQVSVVG